MHHPRRSRRGVLALAAVSALLVPAAIAWACNPQAQLTPNKASYTPGETMTVSGSFYPRGVPIKVAISDGQSAVATTNQSGAFQISGLRVPTAPGSYTITTTRADGQFQSGLPKVASFSIAARASRPAAPRAPAAVQQRGERTFVEPGVSRSPARSVAGGGGSGGGGGQPGVGGGGGQPGGGSTGGVAGGGTIVTGTTGVPVFAGSVAPATTFGAAPVAAQSATPSTAARSTAARSTGRAAAADSDVWSGFANGRTPSLTSDAADAPDSGTGSGLGLGIGLLAVGLLALVAGLTAAEVRRRRASA